MAKLTFLGAAQQVTGSCYLLETPSLGRMLLDCGLHQGSDNDHGERDPGARLSFAPEKIDAVILSHAHLDHSGLLPVLVSQGFKGPIYCTKATARMLDVMLNDSARIYEQDLEYDNLRRQRRGEAPLKPAYGKRDVARTLKLCKPVRYGECLLLGKDGMLCFHDAGHILGSAIVELKFSDEGRQKTLVFSGDLGKQHSVLMNPPSTLTHADLVLMEGTYGNRDHRPLQATVDQFEKILHDTWAAQGNVLIPAFAIGRTQEILLHLGQLHGAGKLDDWQVYLDSPMGIRITDLYEECDEMFGEEEGCRLRANFAPSLQNFLPNLIYAKTPQDSRRINGIKRGMIVIAGSGMCTGGRIRHHLKHRIWNAANTIVFCGFQARGTLGRQLVDGAKRVSMLGHDFAVRARIETLGGFSAHAGQSELLEWAGHFKPAPRLMLVHGEAATLEVLAARLWEARGIKAEIPAPGQSITF